MTDLDKARAVRQELKDRPTILYVCKRGVCSSITVWIEPTCTGERQAWCRCGLLMKKVAG